MAQIAIIMATYNGEEYLREQIDSILKNTCQDFELHVFDDGSKDNTFSIIEEYARNYQEKIFAHKNPQNRGVIRNFLCAAQELEAEYYMFCDQDDYWLSDKIEKTLEKMKETERSQSPMGDTPIVVFGDAKVVDKDLNIICPSFHKHSNLDATKLDVVHLAMENKLIGCTIMFNHALRDKLSEFPKEIRMHDWWVGLVGAALGKVVYINEPLLLYRQHGTNTLGSVTELQYILQNIGDLKKQRQALYDNCYQAGALASVYKDEMDEKKLYLMELFANVPNENWIRRRNVVFSNGFVKTGWLRNMGNFLLL